MLWNVQAATTYRSVLQEGSEPFEIYLQAAVIPDITLRPELIHKNIDPWASGAHHLRKSGLAEADGGGSAG